MGEASQSTRHYNLGAIDEDGAQVRGYGGGYLAQEKDGAQEMTLCRVCSNPLRCDIDQLLATGTSLASISLQYGIEEIALSQHQEHFDQPNMGVEDVTHRNGSGYHCDSRCKAGRHHRHQALGEAYLRNEINLTEYSREVGCSKQSVSRHIHGHLPQAMLKAWEIEQIACADSLLDQLKAVRTKAYSLLSKAEECEDLRAAGIFLREIREQIKLMAELEGRLASQPQLNVNLQQINIYDSPEWSRVGDLLARILEPYPELRVEVAQGLLVLAKEGRHGA